MSTSSVSDFPPSAIRPILEEVTSLLKSRGETISIAETAAGGLISSSLLSTPGASKIYKGGLTVYTLPSRIAYAGWTKETIANYSGPTTDIVSGLAKQVRKDLESTSRFLRVVRLDLPVAQPRIARLVMSHLLLIPTRAPS